MTAGTACGPAKRDNRIDWGSGAQPGTVSPHLGLVLPAEPAGPASPERTLEGPENGQSGQHSSWDLSAGRSSLGATPGFNIQNACNAPVHEYSEPHIKHQ